MPGPSNPRGTYLKVASAIRQAIEADDGLTSSPSHAEIVREYGVSRGVAIRALKVLELEGFIEAVPGARWRTTRNGCGVDSRPLADRITDLIREDALEVGAPLPSTTALCERFEVS